MKARRYKTDDCNAGIEVSDTERGICLMVAFYGWTTSTFLTPAQARRIAAHLVKLAEMREKESKK